MFVISQLLKINILDQGDWARSGRMSSLGTGIGGVGARVRSRYILPSRIESDHCNPTLSPAVENLFTKLFCLTEQNRVLVR